MPLKFLTPQYDVPLVPIHMNCVVPPLPAPERCHAFGQVLAEVVRAWPEKAARGDHGHRRPVARPRRRPKYFDVDEKFDRWFLELLGTGDAGRVLREATIERMIAAGDGGTVELLAWLVAMGAAGRRAARTDFYVPSVALRCGMGGVNWNAV